MKLFFVLIFLSAFLPACSVYTITNKTLKNITIKTSGSDTTILKAGACMELTEYFLGTGGDFPFILDGNKDREYSADHYEIKVKPGSENSETFEYLVSQSNQNSECKEASSQDQKIKLAENMIPMCGTGTSAKTAQCKSSDSSTAGVAKCTKEQKKPVCVDAENKALLNNITPQCESDSGETPLCQEQAEPLEDTFYTITLKSDNAFATLLAGTTTKVLNTNSACIKIKQTQFSSLTVSLGTTDGGAHNKGLCNKCPAGNYEITTTKDSVSGLITDSQFNTVTSSNNSQQCIELK